MSALRMTTTVNAVDLNTGEKFKARRTAIGMSVNALAKAANVDRGSLAALEKGHDVRDTTVAAVDKALADLEHQLGMDVPSVVEPVVPTEAAEPLRFTFHDVFGIGEIIAEGPVDRPDELVASIAALLAEIRKKPEA